MRLFINAILAAALITPGVANAQTLDFRTATCSDFVALPEDALDIATAWLDGHLSDEEDPESMTVDVSGTDAEDIKAHCQQNPGANLIQAVDSMDQ